MFLRACLNAGVGCVLRACLNADAELMEQMFSESLSVVRTKYKAVRS